MNNQKLAKVMWQDHCSYSEWMSLSEAQSIKPVIAETVGWIIYDCDEYIIVAGERGSLDTTFSNLTVIIKSCIVGIKDL